MLFEKSTTVALVTTDNVKNHNPKIPHRTSYISKMEDFNATLGDSPSPEVSAIVSGYTCPIETIPFAVFLRDRIFFVVFCGGSLITARWVLTASHCVTDFVKYSNYVEVVAGASDFKVLGADAQTSKVKAIYPHPKYKQKMPEWNDVAMVKLMDEMRLGGRIAKAMLPKKAYADVDELVSVCGDGFVAGWGAQVGDIEPLVLMEDPRRRQLRNRDGLLKCMKVIGVPDNTCKWMTGMRSTDLIPECLVCVIKEDYGASGGTPCYGDSGGPLVCDGVLVGVAHSVVRCGWPKFPFFYSRVDLNMEFILNTIENGTKMSFSRWLVLEFVCALILNAVV